MPFLANLADSFDDELDVVRFLREHSQGRIEFGEAIRSHEQRLSATHASEVFIAAQSNKRLISLVAACGTGNFQLDALRKADHKWRSLPTAKADQSLTR